MSSIPLAVKAVMKMAAGGFRGRMSETRFHTEVHHDRNQHICSGNRYGFRP